MPGLIFITDANQIAISWAVSAAAIIFLTLSAWRNPGSGYHGQRPGQSGIARALRSLTEFRASLAADDDAALPAPAGGVSQDNQPTDAGLRHLDSALQRNKGMTPSTVEAPVPESVPAEVQAPK
jgi:hypothetical protein